MRFFIIFIKQNGKSPFLVRDSWNLHDMPELLFSFKFYPPYLRDDKNKYIFVVSEHIYLNLYLCILIIVFVIHNNLRGDKINKNVYRHI